jgi:hypothetical protein
MKTLVSFAAAFVSAWAAVLLLMFVMSYFEPHALKPLVAVGIAAGIAVAAAIRTNRAISRHGFALLVGVLVGVGCFLGNWFSNG